MAFLARFFGIAGILFSLCGIATSAQANDLRLVEQKIKAGLLYNFIKHTMWPSDIVSVNAKEPPALTVCIYGKDVFADYVAPMSGRTVNQRKIHVQSIRSVEEAASCDVVFISAQMEEYWLELREFLNSRPVLTVSDYPGFAQSGGMIEFQKKQQHIGAVFNLGAFVQAALEVSESLLGLSGIETLHQAEEVP